MNEVINTGTQQPTTPPELRYYGEIQIKSEVVDNSSESAFYGDVVVRGREKEAESSVVGKEINSGRDCVVDVANEYVATDVGKFAGVVRNVVCHGGPKGGDAKSVGPSSHRPPQHKAVSGECRVCGDEATGMYFGALVCVSCKTFFLRYDGNGVNFVCKLSQNCSITIRSRTQCKYCRYHKCQAVGMSRRVRPAEMTAREGQQLCAVCGDIGNGVHFGAITCEGCKKFFRRGLSEQNSYTCMSNERCTINPRTRNSCRYCRYKKCQSIGMSRDAIQMGRPSKLPNDPTSSATRRSSAQAAESSGHQASSSNTVVRVPGLAHHGFRRTVSDTSMCLDPPDLNSFVLDLSRTGAGAGASVNVQDQKESQRLREVRDILLKRKSEEFRQQHVSSGGVQPDSTVAWPRTLWSGMPRHFVPSTIVSGLHQEHLPSFSQGSAEQSSNAQMDDQLAHAGVKKRILFRSMGLKLDEIDCDDTDASVTSPGEIASSFKRIRLAEDYVKSDRVISDVFRGGTNQASAISASSVQQNNQPFVTKVIGNTNGSKYKQCALTAKKSKSVKNCLSDASRSCGSPSVSSSVGTAEECPPLQMTCEDDHVTTLDCDSAIILSMSVEMEGQMSMSNEYWLNPQLPKYERSPDQCWPVINSIIPLYDKYLRSGAEINRSLKTTFQEWSNQAGEDRVLSKWIEENVVPQYTTTSVNYCRSIPGFVDFNPEDQVRIIRLGQSPSRILLAALNWYDQDRQTFNNFLSWRDRGDGTSDLFKRQLIKFAAEISLVEVDPIEAALLNVLLILATDYPGLKNKGVIEEERMKILSTLITYVTTKFDQGNDRLSVLFKHVPELRRLGLLHYQMTRTQTMTAEEVENEQVG